MSRTKGARRRGPDPRWRARKSCYSAALKTVGSFWPYATTLWDYINRAMPFDKPGLLKPSEVYAVAAYILNLNGIIGDNDIMDAKTLPKVKMPNRAGFVSDPRPDVGPKPNNPK